MFRPRNARSGHPFPSGPVVGSAPLASRVSAPVCADGGVMDISIGTMVLFPAVAVAAPLVRAFERWVPIPLVVFEIVLGLLLGPAVLGWIVPDDFTAVLADFGLAMLFFLAGNEIDFSAIRGRSLNRAAIGWIMSIAAGIGIAALLAPHISS